MKAPKIKKYQDRGTPKYATKKMTAKEWEEHAKANKWEQYPGSAPNQYGYKSYYDTSKYKFNIDPNTGQVDPRNSTPLVEGIAPSAQNIEYDYEAPKNTASPHRQPSPYVAEGHKPLAIGTAGTYDPNTGTTYIDPSKKTGTIDPIVEQYKSGGKIMKAPSLKKKVGKYANGGTLTPEEQSQGAYIQNGVKYSANGAPITNGTEFKTSGATANQGTTNPTATGMGQKNNNTDVAGKVGQGMAWMQYANMAQEAGRAGLKKDVTVDPATGEEITKYRSEGDAAAESLMKPQHEAVLGDVKSGNYGDAAGHMFLGSAYDLIKNKGSFQDPNVDKKLSAIEDRTKTAQNMGTRNERSSLAKGGTIKGPGTGKSDSILSRIGDKGIASGSFIVPEENNEMAKSIRAKILGDNPEKTASFKKLNGGGETEADVAVSNGEHLFTPKEKKKITAMLGEEVLEKLAPEAEENDEMNCGGKVKLKGGGTVPEGTKLGKYYYKKGNWIDASGNKLTKEFGQKYTDAYFKQTGGKSKDQLEMEADVRAANEKNNPGYNSPTKTADQLASLQDTKPSQLGAKKSAPKVNKETVTIKDMGTIEPIQTSTKALNLDTATPQELVAEQQMQIKDVETNVPQTETKRGSSVLSGIGSAMEYAMPIAQGIMGYDYLNKAGKRPVDAMDPDFVQSVEKAKQNAMFGFTPEEKFAIDQQNQNLTNAARFTARNLSGGSAATALSNERAAVNDAYMRGLDSIIKGKQLQMSKQSYADQMIQAKQNKSRQLFGDTLNAWGQNQEAGSELVGAAIRNAIGAKRYQDELQAQKNINQAGNAWTNTI